MVSISREYNIDFLSPMWMLETSLVSMSLALIVASAAEQNDLDFFDDLFLA